MMHLQGATPDVLDTLYNARLALPHAEATFADWANQSANTRSRFACLLDLPYGQSPLERLDYFPTAIAHQDSDEHPPLLVFIHGGYWRSRDKSEFSFIAQPYVRAGINVAILNYDLLPAVPMSTLCLQIVGAITWLARRHDSLCFALDKITVAGHSAGGHLAAMAACANWAALLSANCALGAANSPQNLIAHFVCLSGLFDLEPLTRAPFLKNDFKLSADQALIYSPAFFPAPTSSTGLLAVGQHESLAFHEQAHLLQSQWSNVVRQNMIVDNTDHLTICAAMADEKSPLTRALIDLMNTDVSA